MQLVEVGARVRVAVNSPSRDGVHKLTWAAVLGGHKPEKKACHIVKFAVMQSHLDRCGIRCESNMQHACAELEAELGRDQ